MLSPKRSWWSPIFLTLLTSLALHLSMVKCLEKKSTSENFRANGLIHGGCACSQNHILWMRGNNKQEFYFKAVRECSTQWNTVQLDARENKTLASQCKFYWTCCIPDVGVNAVNVWLQQQVEIWEVRHRLSLSKNIMDPQTEEFY